jgi:spore coat protein U-like protein
MHAGLSSRIAAAILILSPLAHASAASGTASFNVSVQVLAACSISASNMNFGGITTGTTNITDATSSLTVNCPNGTPYTIGLSNGANYSGGRRMSNGMSNINYDLYTDASRGNPWQSTVTQSGTGNGGDQSFVVYGRIPSGQAVPYTGSYSDTIVATITY